MQRRYIITSRDLVRSQLPNNRHRLNLAWYLSRVWALLLGLRHP